MASIRAAEDIPADAVSASVSLDGVMVALRAGEGGCAEACWREASCGTVSFHDAKGMAQDFPDHGQARSAHHRLGGNHPLQAGGATAEALADCSGSTALPIWDRNRTPRR